MSKQQQPPPRDNGPKAKNQGEGDTESARRYNESQQDFVNSARPRAAIDDAGEVDPDELEDLEDAEQAGLARAKEEDPAVLRRNTATKAGKQ